MCVLVLYICALLLCVGAHTSKRVGVVVAVAEARLLLVLYMWTSAIYVCTTAVCPLYMGATACVLVLYVWTSAIHMCTTAVCGWSFQQEGWSGSSSGGGARGK